MVHCSRGELLGIGGAQVGAGGEQFGIGGAQDGAGGEQLCIGGPQDGAGFGAGLAATLQAGIHWCTGCTCDATLAGGAKRIVTFLAGGICGGAMIITLFAGGVC